MAIKRYVKQFLLTVIFVVLCSHHVDVYLSTITFYFV